MTEETIDVDVVIPTIGRPSLAVLLASLAASDGPRPRTITLVDDRRDRTAPLALGALDAAFADRVKAVVGRAAGPASARNVGWRIGTAPWVAFLDDDVVVSPTWLADLARDLRALDDATAGSQGRVTVPLPADRRPTDWERNVAHLATAQWITADFAYRRGDLEAVDGFDERFPRAYREDSDLALRILARGRRLVVGTRTIRHPVRPAPWDISIRLQAGNADDALMDALHGTAWRADARADRGTFRGHVAAVAFAALAVGGASGFALVTGAFAWKRIAPGPRTPREMTTMVVTSAAIPFAAVAHRLRGIARARGVGSRLRARTRRSLRASAR